MVDWKKTTETFYVLIMLVSLIAVFSSLNPLVGVIWASILTLITAFFEAIFGYILFEKIII